MTDITKLLEEDAWLRSLAFRLAGPDHADDALQQAWIKFRAQDSTIRNPAAWFTRVIGNFAARRARDQKAREVHEQGYAAGRPSSALPTADLVARMEQQRLVAEAVLALEEPYRSTVIAHFVDGKSTKEIAAQLGEPWATVRSRLSRAIENLRKKLVKEDRDWQANLAMAVFGVPNSRLARPPVLASSLFSYALVAILLGSVSLPIILLGMDSAAVESPIESARKDEAAATANTESQESREELLTPEASQAAIVQENALVTYVGELLDLEGSALPDVELYVDDRRVAKTDLEGRFTIELEAGEHELESGSDFEILCAAPLRADRLNRFLATPGVRIHGKVVDAENGQAIPGAELIYWNGTPVDYPYALGELTFRAGPEPFLVDADGKFDFLVPWMPGASVGARIDGRQSTQLEFGQDPGGGFTFSLFGEDEGPKFETAPTRIIVYRESVEVQFAVKTGQKAIDPSHRNWVIEGLVIDQDQRPVVDARVAFGHHAAVRSKSDGRFRISPGLGRLRDGGSLVAWHPELGAAVLDMPLDRWRALGNKNPQETLRLAPADQSIEGQLQDRDGMPLAGMRICIAAALVTRDPRGGIHTVESDASQTRVLSEVDGKFTLGGLLNREYRLKVLDEASFFSFETAPIRAGSEGLVIVVPAAAGHLPAWKGRIVDADGQGIPGVTVTVSLWEPLGSIGQRVAHSVEFSSDEEGRVLLPTHVGADLAVTFKSPGRMIDARPRGGLDASPVRLGRLASFRYRPENPPPSTNQRMLAVLDDQDRQLVIRGPYAGSILEGFTYYLTQGNSAVLETSEFATTLVIATDGGPSGGQELHRIPIQLVPGEVTEVR